MSPEVCGVMLFRSVKYPLGSTTVCPDTESETCDKRKGDKICYQIQIKSFPFNVRTVHQTICIQSSYNDLQYQRKIKNVFFLLVFFFHKGAWKKSCWIGHWSAELVVNINWSMTWSSLIPNMEFLASPIWLRSIRDEVANPGVIVPGVTDMAPGYGVMKPPSIWGMDKYMQDVSSPDSNKVTTVKGLLSQKYSHLHVFMMC